MAKLAAGLVPAYAFHFENSLAGYAYWPMLALVGLTWVYLMLPPMSKETGAALKKKRWELGGDGEPFPFPLLAVAAAAYFLDQRDDPLLTIPWLIHLCLVSLLLLIVPYVAASVVGRAKATVTVCTTFALMFLLWQGTVIKKNHHPFLDDDGVESSAYQEASAPKHQAPQPATPANINTKHTRPSTAAPVLRSM
jgi:hypothetical protein